MERMERNFPPATGDEVQIVEGWLDWQRATVQRKCEGLVEQAGRAQPVTGSSMSITALVWHLAWVEHHWFEVSFLGLDQEPDANCGWSNPGPLAEALAAYAEGCGRSRDIVADSDPSDLERYAPPGLPVVSLRWILGHVLEETARHLGHLDLLRESIDGERGY